MRLAYAFVILSACARDEARVAVTVAPPPKPLVVAPVVVDAGAVERVVVRAAVRGSWIGSATFERSSPMLVVSADLPMLGPGASEIASIALAAMPFVAAELAGPADLCGDEPAAPGALAVRCLTDHGVAHVAVRAIDGELEIATDGAAPRRWRLPGVASARFELRGLGVRRDVDALRAAWGRDVPSERCRDAKPRAAVRVAMRFPIVADNYSCGGVAIADAGPTSGPLDRTRVQLAVGGVVRDLGVLSEQCAGLHLVRYDDADAVVFGTSDMGAEHRFAYRLGDRLYFSTAEGGVARIDLPCGARATFDFPSHVVTDHANVKP